ncbi:MAG TPA: MFS transporter [Rhizomicrobium sp.]|jgi:MFS family permease|nr:MFS transporter [Rhizomicrobium sp.]
MSPSAARIFDKKAALAFIVAFGVVSLFADMAYEGMRGISGPFLGLLGASAAVVGIVAGTGELAGYLLRLVSGNLAQRSAAYWPFAIAGYAIQMAAVPALALAGNWRVAALLIVLERAGKAVRNPAGNTMMSHAGEEIGHGWAFGLHEALDQTGALAGPLIAALVLAHHGFYRDAFLWLGIPAALTIVIVVMVAFRFPEAARIPAAPDHERDRRLSRTFWFYSAAAALSAFGFADYPLISYHFSKAHTVSAALVPVFYAGAMGTSGAAALLFGRWFDSRGLSVMVPGLLTGAFVAPLVFLGGFGPALIGTLLWGVALGVQGSVMSASIAQMIPVHDRARAFGIFTAIFGVAWFLGSAALGALYDVSRLWLVAVSVLPQLAALVPLALALQETKRA